MTLAKFKSAIVAAHGTIGATLDHHAHAQALASFDSVWWGRELDDARPINANALVISLWSRK